MMTLIDLLFLARFIIMAKSPVGEDPSRSNMASIAKHCSNLRDSTFIKFNDHCQVN